LRAAYKEDLTDFMKGKTAIQQWIKFLKESPLIFRF